MRSRRPAEVSNVGREVLPMVDEIVLDSPIDCHVHLRQGELLRRMVPHTAATFAAAVVMPNTDPPIMVQRDLMPYGRAILDAHDMKRPFAPKLTAYFGRHLSREQLERLRPHIVAVKYYPAGLTTNSQHGCDPSEPWVDRV